MKIYRIIEKICLYIINSSWTLFVKIHEIKNIYKKRKIYKNVVLTKEQKKQIDNFYKENYGKKVSYKWHRLYTSYTGKFDYKYVPEYLFTTKIERIGNKRLDVLPYENKIMLNTLFEGVSKYIEIPKTYLMKIKGKYFDENCEVITEEDAINILNKKYNDFIIKISTDSNSGRGVGIYKLKNGVDENTNLSTIEIIKKYGNNFIVQELIKQHEVVNKLYDKSINTLRVITYITDTGYHVAPIVMRIGRGGKNVDNAHAGGIFIAIDDNGKLCDIAYSENNISFRNHPDTNYKFHGVIINNYDILKKEIIKLHKKIPNVRFISWDIAINNNEIFSLIEANMHSHSTWFTQMAHGKGLLEENTEELLKEIK